jgi:hypothetical protein
VVRQLFEPLLGRERRRALAGAAATAEAVFTAPAGADPADSSFAALHELYWLAANLTEEGPLALVVDDLHWCDRASLRFLAVHEAVAVEAHRRGSLFAATAAQIFRVAKFFGTQDAVRLRALKARVDPDGTVVANHPV